MTVKYYRHNITGNVYELKDEGVRTVLIKNCEKNVVPIKIVKEFFEKAFQPLPGYNTPLWRLLNE